MIKKRLTALLFAAALTAGCTLAALAETPVAPESTETVVVDTVKAPQYGAAGKLATPNVEWGAEINGEYTDSVASWDKVPNARSYEATLFAWNDAIHANVPVHTFTVPQPAKEEKVWVPFCVYADENTGYYMDVVAMNREDGYEDSDHGQTDGHMSRELMGTPWESIERVATPTDVHWDEDHNAVFTLGEGNGARVDVYKLATNELIYSDCFYGAFGQWLGEQMFPLSEVMAGLPTGDYYFRVVASDSFSGMRNSLPSEPSMTYHKIDTTQISAFVARLYSLCLSRAPRDGEDASWVDDLAYGVKTGSECAYGFYFSQEFTGKNYSNAEYVTLLYRAMMGREPDEGGLQDWVGRLAAGTPREVVFNGFVGSQEFTNLCASYGIVRGDGDGISAFVDRLYRVCFDRGPDVSGFNDWTAKLRTQTATGTEVAHGFACSQEMANLGLNDEQYVEAMYLAFFDREYDDAGKADWLNRMHAQGYDREQVFYGFAGSQEFDNLCNRYGILR